MNCKNCGGPRSATDCPYCGTSYRAVTPLNRTYSDEYVRIGTTAATGIEERVRQFYAQRGLHDTIAAEFAVAQARYESELRKAEILDRLSL